MKNESIWKKDLTFQELPALKENMDVDVLIIGGGITGISALYHLKDSNLKTILVERNVCGLGVTSKSTAKITYLQQDLYQKINTYVNEEAASLYLKSQLEATRLLVDIIKKERISCDFENSPSYLFTNDKANLNKLKEEYLFLKDNGVFVEKVNKLPFKENFLEAFRVNDTYTFHPLKYINFMKSMLKKSIYEHSSVLEIKKEKDYYLCSVNGCEVKTKYVILAAHYPSFLFPFLMPLKCSIETSYIGSKKITNNSSFNAINLDQPCVSLRTYQSDNKNQLIYLYQSLPSSNIKNIHDYFGSLKEKGFSNLWSNNDIITGDFLPFIGKLKENDDTFLIATGYNTWGMTNGTLAGKILTDMILKRYNSYSNLFAPHRSINIGKMVHFPLDVGRSMKAFLKGSRFNVNNSNVIYTERDGKSVAIYKDQNGKEHIVLNRCPHMKCGIIFNEVEQTWDCYCHGSRFDLDGKVIEGPSNFDIQFKSE